MKNALLGLLAAVGLHTIVFLFGGILIPKGEQQEKKKELIEVVELDKKEEKKEEEQKEKLDDPVADVKQEMPDFRELNQPAASAAPALAAVSLSDLGSALSGIGGEGGFGGGVGFGSGVIGGTPGGMGGLGGSDMLSGSQLDSQPQATNRASPRLNPDLRKQIKGKVEVLLIIGKDGAVQKAEILSTPNPAANAACIEAARQWRFQPGSRGGKPVQFKLKLPFRFD